LKKDFGSFCHVLIVGRACLTIGLGKVLIGKLQK
jgi:hypothetical protein